MTRTPAIVLLLVLAVTPATAIAVPDSATLGGEALYWSIVGAPVDQRFTALLSESGLVLSPEEQAAFDELLALLSSLENELVREIAAQQVPKWFTIGFEGCTGSGSCGGSYTDDDSTHGSWNTYNNNQTVNNENATLCSNNSYWTVTYVLSENPQFCHIIVTNGYNVETSEAALFGQPADSDCIDPGLPCYLVETHCAGTPLDKGRICRGLFPEEAASQAL